MNGELAQVIALATHGTTWLSDPDAAEPPALETNNSTFDYVTAVRFASADASAAETVAAAWLRGLLDRGITRLWLDVPDPLPPRQRWPHLEPHVAVSFSNGGRWQLLATGEGSNEFWRPAWTVGSLDAPDRKIWSVAYEQAAAGTNARPTRPDVALATSALEAALRDARDFATQVNEEFWASQFEGALQSNATPPYNADMVPEAWPAEARRLIAMASRAWVFGGMGSWNDLGFSDGARQAQYEELSRLLFANVIQACVAAVNCRLPDEQT